MSLRDVLRVLDVMVGFLEHDEPLFQLMDAKLNAKLQQDTTSDDEEDQANNVCEIFMLIY